MHAGSWEDTREAFEWHEANPSVFLAFRVLSQLPKCIHNSIEAQLNHGPFFKNIATATLFSIYKKTTLKLIKYEILKAMF